MFILGIADLIAALLLTVGLYHFPVPATIIYIFAVYLTLKGLIFIRDIGSLMDLAGGILLILNMHFPFLQPLSIIFAVLIGTKGLLSIMGGVVH